MISIIIPTLNRPIRLENCLNSLISTLRSDIKVEVIPVIDKCDKETIEILNAFKLRYLEMEPPVTPVQKWNYGFQHASNEWILLGADDISFSYRWIERTFDTPNRGFFGFHDGISQFDKGFMPHYMATKWWYKTYQNGVMCVPHYKHWGPDLEACSRAINSKTYAISPAPLIHLHPYFSKEIEFDSTYKKGREYQDADLDLWAKRSKLNFPNDFDSII
jgi:glycosyltransferase involved in cell wall biosynthesis